MAYQKLKNGKIRFVWPDCGVRDIFLVGDFNQWNERSHPLRRIKDRSYELELEIPPGKYRFKYLVDGVWWNDPDAEEYAPNPWGSEDSVIRID
jgi:1,4-alpha-glucan branching enzyme